MYAYFWSLVSTHNNIKTLMAPSFCSQGVSFYCHYVFAQYWWRRLDWIESSQTSFFAKLAITACSNIHIFSPIANYPAYMQAVYFLHICNSSVPEAEFLNIQKQAHCNAWCCSWWLFRKCYWRPIGMKQATLATLWNCREPPAILLQLNWTWRNFQGFKTTYIAVQFQWNVPKCNLNSEWKEERDQSHKFFELDWDPKFLASCA